MDVFRKVMKAFIDLRSNGAKQDELERALARLFVCGLENVFSQILAKALRRKAFFETLKLCDSETFKLLKATYLDNNCWRLSRPSVGGREAGWIGTGFSQILAKARRRKVFFETLKLCDSEKLCDF